MDKYEIIKNDEIDLLALFKVIWNGRRIILYSILTCFIIGLVIAFTSEKKYIASGTLLPAENDKSSSLGGLGALAGMAGINMGSMLQNTNSIRSELFPEVVNSTPYLLDLMNQKDNWKGSVTLISLFDYYKGELSKQSESVVLKYTLKLPFTIANALSSSDDKKKSAIISDQVDYLSLDKNQLFSMGQLKSALSIEFDKKTSLILLKAETNDPIFSSQLASKAIDLLQKYIIAYKTKQSVEKLTFITGRYDETKKEYEVARYKLIEYKDSHRNMINERMDNEYQLLVDAYDLSSSLFKSLAQQLEQARITVKEETPVFTVLDPVVVPTEKSGPKRSMILAVSVFLGVFFGLGWIFGRLVWVNLWKRAS